MRAFNLFYVHTINAATLNQLLHQRNLVSIEQLIESTPPPTLGYSEDKEGAEFLNNRLGRVLSQAGNVGLDASIVQPAEAAVSTSNADPSAIFEELLALMRKAAPMPSTSAGETSLGLPSLVVPSLPPLVVPSAAEAYNSAIENIKTTAEKYHLPSINAFNATVPQIDSVGSGAGLPDVLELVGQNLGTSMGASAGNIAAGTSGLLTTYAKSLKDGFVSVLANFGGATRRRLDDDEDKDEKRDRDVKRDNKEKKQRERNNDIVGQKVEVDRKPDVPYDPYSQYGGMQLPPVDYPPPSVMFPAPYVDRRHPWGDMATWGDGRQTPRDSLNARRDPSYGLGIGTYGVGDGGYGMGDGGYGVGDGGYGMGDGGYGMGDGAYEQRRASFMLGDGRYRRDNYYNEVGYGGETGGYGWREARRLLSAEHLRDGFSLLGSRRQLLSSMTPFSFSLADLQNPTLLKSALNSTLPNSLFSALSFQDSIFNNPFFTNPNSLQTLTNSLTALSNPLANDLVPTLPPLPLSPSPSLTPFSVPSLPVVDPIIAEGLAAVAVPPVPSLPETVATVGTSIGDAFGSTVGGIVGGLTNLVGTTAHSATSGFFEGAKNPVVAQALAPKETPSPETPSPSRLLSAKRPVPSLSRRLQSAEGDGGLIEGVSCAIRGSAFSSSRLMTFTNIESLRVCQLICQTYSDPLVIYGCSDVSSLGDVCLAVSFHQVGGRCDLHFALDGEYEIEGFDAAPVVCPDTTFVQPATQIQNILNTNSNGSACLEAQAVSIQRVQETAKPLPLALATAPVLPALPNFLNENAANDSIWRFNPDVPDTSEFRIDLIYQVQQVAQPPPAGKAFWGAVSDVVDWRQCALFCVVDSDCRFWTYIFDPETYNETRAACRLATNTEPVARTLAGGPRAISGPRLTHLPLELFGPALNQSAPTSRRLFADSGEKKWRAIVQPPARLEETPLLPSIVDKRLLASLTGRQLQETAVQETAAGRVPCEEFGFVYHSAYSALTSAKTIPTNLFSLTALTAEKCREACERTTGCKGFQLVPVATLAASSRLQGTQRSSCLLLSQVAHKIPADPLIISGVLSSSSDRLCSVNELPLSTAVIGHSLEDIEEAVAGALDESDRGDQPSEGDGETETETAEASETGCVTTEGYGRQFDRDISYRGRLVSGRPNVISGVKNAAECWRECSGVAECEAFSWGPWQGCYLLSTVENMLVADEGIVSGYKVCELNEAREYETLKRRLQAVGGIRDVSTCGRAVRGRVYNEGALIANLTEENLTENQCFHKCRVTHDCYFITYYNTQQANRRLQLVNKPTSTTPLRKLQQQSEPETYRETPDAPLPATPPNALNPTGETGAPSGDTIDGQGDTVNPLGDTGMSLGDTIDGQGGSMIDVGAPLGGASDAPDSNAVIGQQETPSMDISPSKEGMSPETETPTVESETPRLPNSTDEGSPVIPTESATAIDVSHGVSIETPSNNVSAADSPRPISSEKETPAGDTDSKERPGDETTGEETTSTETVDEGVVPSASVPVKPTGGVGGGEMTIPLQSTCLLFERVGTMVNVQAGLGVSAEMQCDVLGDLSFEEPEGHRSSRQLMIPTLVVVASGGLIFVAAAFYIGVRERRRHQKEALIRNLEIASPSSSLTPSSFGHINFNAFGMKSPMRVTASPDRLERGSPAAKVLDFEAVEPKSTGKRLKKTF